MTLRARAEQKRNSCVWCFSGNLEGSLEVFYKVMDNCLGVCLKLFLQWGWRWYGPVSGSELGENPETSWAQWSSIFSSILTLCPNKLLWVLIHHNVLLLCLITKLARSTSVLSELTQERRTLPSVCTMKKFQTTQSINNFPLQNLVSADKRVECLEYESIKDRIGNGYGYSKFLVLQDGCSSFGKIHSVFICL